MTRWAKRMLGAGVVAGGLYALWRVVEERTRASTLEWTSQPFPSPPMPVPHDAEPALEDVAPPSTPRERASADTAWVAPDHGLCPVSHPVKAKLASGIFHVPDGQMYDRTVPDRCYRDATAAEADGLRASKR